MMVEVFYANNPFNETKRVIQYAGRQYDFKNWHEKDISFQNRLIRVVEGELTCTGGLPKELEGKCLVVIGYINGSYASYKLAHQILDGRERKEISNLLKQKKNKNVLFSYKRNLVQLTFDFFEKK